MLLAFINTNLVWGIWIHVCLTLHLVKQQDDYKCSDWTETKRTICSPAQSPETDSTWEEGGGGAERKLHREPKSRKERKKGREGDGEGLGVREQWSRAGGSSYEGFGLTREFITRTQHADNKTPYHTCTCGDSCSTALSTNNWVWLNKPIGIHPRNTAAFTHKSGTAPKFLFQL